GPFHLEIVRKVRRLLSLQHPERSDALGAQSKDAGTNRYHDSPHPSTTAVSFPKPKETASAQDAEVSTLSPSIPTVPTNSHNFPFPKPKETPCAQDADVSASIPSIPTVPTNSHNFPFSKPKETPSAQDADVSPSLLISSSPLPLSPPLFILSNWQFLNSPRWVARIQLWERVGLTTEDVAPNDYLLDWRRGGEGLRYVHHFSEDELAKLAQDTGFEVTETFHSDGAEGNLGLYQIWRPI
ncbi:MAG TPA: hypothetical protein PK530_03960, partial [Anaerolineales bacterium]|nr:hypothetical protein [Anaerolineales bacterium]